MGSTGAFLLGECVKSVEEYYIFAISDGVVGGALM